MKKLWRKLFKKYNCRKCRDTFVVETRQSIYRCGCKGSREALERELHTGYTFLRKVLGKKP